MKTCKLIDFMAVVKPWLDDEYLREAYVNSQGQVVLQFNDGVKNIYRIDDCTEHQLASVLEELKNSGVRVRN